MPVIDHDISLLAERVIADLASARLEQQKDRVFYPVFNLAYAAPGNRQQFEALQQLAGDLASYGPVAERFEQMEAEGMSAQFVIYDEPGGHFLSVKVNVH